MGMASLTEDETLIRTEFRNLRTAFTHLKNAFFSTNDAFREISMGMTGDYAIAVEEGSTMARLGTAIFGERSYH